MAAHHREPYDQPAYQVAPAARYVGVPQATLRLWIGAEGLIQTPRPGHLSWNNLAEAHVLKAMRQQHHLSMQSIRRALAELSRHRPSPHPLLQENFATYGMNLCLMEEGQITNLSQASQLEIREVVELYLHRIERDGAGVARRLYPFISRNVLDDPKHISISPLVSFGRPVLAGTGIATAVVAGRFVARDSVEDLAREYEVDPGLLEDAIRWELLKGKAA